MTYRKLLMLIGIGLISPFLAGCGSLLPKLEVIKEYVYVHDDIPQALLADCYGYDGPIVDNGDLAEAYITERQGRLACSADKQGLREWSDSVKGKP